MTEGKDQKSKTLTLSTSKLELGKVESDRVPQSLAHGRVNSVAVQVKRKRRRIVKPGDASESADTGASKVSSSKSSKSSLTNNEQDNRLKVLQQAAQSDERERIVEEEKIERNRLTQERQEEERRQTEADEQARLKQEALDAQQLAESEGRKAESDDGDVADGSSVDANKTVDQSVVKPIKSSDRVESVLPAKKFKDKAADPAEEKKEERRSKPSRGDIKRRSNKLTISQALSGGNEERMRSLASVRRAREKARRLSEGPKEKEKVIRDVIIPEVITVQELANRMAERVYDVIKSLMKMGMVVTASQTVDADTAELIVTEFGHNLKRVTDADVEDILKDTEEETAETMVWRAPVVTFMGHVDHGKTSLLDAIRQSTVASGEAGGITQHIGAYQVETDAGDKVTFLDTPGHEAFTAMRKRGANATDIVVLVVAADDGIMAQTVEAINHAKAANVPIIVAINKIDKPDANPQAVKNSLLEHDLVTEDFGGDVLSVEVSAKSGENLDKLIEGILLQAEILELKAPADRRAQGIVVESELDKGKGIVATLLVQKGTLNVGDLIVAGVGYGKVRAMMDASGAQLYDAGPSVPVEVSGLDLSPDAGVEFGVIESERQAREIVEFRKRRVRDLKSVVDRKTTLEDLFLQAGEGGIKELPILIKADVQGSVEAIAASLEKLSNDEVKVRCLHSAVGGITESDIMLASASNAIVLGFNVRADVAAKDAAVKEAVDLRYYSIIYDLVDDIKAILGGMLKPIIREERLGAAEIREVYSLTKRGKVAGCYVNDGVIKRGSGVRLLRDNVVIHEGHLKTLRRFKDDVKEVGTNFECGMAFENYDDIKVNDVIEAFELVVEARVL